MEKNPYNIKLVAVDMDGTFARTDYTYDRPRFKVALSRMNEAGCRFVVASGNQYYQLRSLFPGYHHELSFVAENGALVKDKEDVLFSADISQEAITATLELLKEHPEVKNVMCGLESAYCERGTVSDAFFELTNKYYHKLKWVDDFSQVEDKILKFAPTVPVEKTEMYCDLFREKLNGFLVPTGSGHGSVDLIVPNCHKASGLERLVQRWGITPEQCVSFGDGGNDLEMLAYCGRGYAMENAPDNVKEAADYVCPSNDEDGVLVTLDQLFPIN
ncbi:Cof-type HAD-IIB family hydrolase [Enterococcus sp. DIV0240a]|jgi:Cof subfamily protein (haloacid dehalogenase superfamily)|uniref:Cof-type HAD-IIB family hydrolase n=2 Tax=Enterococcus TaxID=1350 RepID=UPI003D2DEDA6